MTERNDRIADLVRKLQHLLEPYNCVGLRTDYIVSEHTGANRRCFIPERHGAANRNALLSSRPNIRQRSRSILDSFLGCGDEVAEQVLDAALELSEINDIGAWAFAPDDRLPRRLNGSGVESKRFKRLPGIEHAYLTIKDKLPQIERINLMTHTGMRNVKRKAGAGEAVTGNKSIKGWMHFYDAAGDQVCAISTSLLATSVRSFFCEDKEEEREKAFRHLGRWANQTNTELSDFIEAASHLLNLDSYLAITEILLGND